MFTNNNNDIQKYFDGKTIEAKISRSENHANPDMNIGTFDDLDKRMYDSDRQIMVEACLGKVGSYVNRETGVCVQGNFKDYSSSDPMFSSGIVCKQAIFKNGTVDYANRLPDRGMSPYGLHSVDYNSIFDCNGRVNVFMGDYKHPDMKDVELFGMFGTGSFN